jgi:septal ring-binding cell division protein DamX
MMKLRFTRAWRGYRTGQVVEIAGGLARQLLAQGVAQEDRQQQLIETAAIEPHTETADATPRRRMRRAVPQPDSTDSPGR